MAPGVHCAGITESDVRSVAPDHLWSRRCHDGFSLRSFARRSSTVVIVAVAAPTGLGGGLLNLLILVLLATAVLIVGTSEPRQAIGLLAAQSTTLAGIALVVAV